MFGISVIEFFTHFKMVLITFGTSHSDVDQNIVMQGLRRKLNLVSNEKSVQGK